MDILFLGGDKRYKYMMMDLACHHSVSQIGFDISNENIQNLSLEDLVLSDFDIVLFPISGINDNMEIKAETGNIKLSESLFCDLNADTLFFTGLKTSKLLQLIRSKSSHKFLRF